MNLRIKAKLEAHLAHTLSDNGGGSDTFQTLLWKATFDGHMTPHTHPEENKGYSLVSRAHICFFL